MSNGESTFTAYTRRGYRLLLQAALDGRYSFLPFDDPRIDGDDPFCLLRHDVDADLAPAVELAKIEGGLGIVSTYFVMLRSATYNLFSRSDVRLVHEILSLGHRLGLHYDVAFASEETDHTANVTLEREFMSAQFDVDVTAVSFHQPGLCEHAADVVVEGAVNAYAYQHDPRFFYLSDSNKSPRILRALDIFRSRRHPRLQLLIHPMWWATDAADLSPEDLWDEAILSNWRRSHAQLHDVEDAFGPERELIIKRAQP